jgi:membrane protease YdiL (CAAX protease family)
VSAVRTDFRLLAAAIAPLLFGPWLPHWDSSIFRAGLAGAIIFCISIAVAEEVIFRGAIQGWLLRKEGLRSRLIGVSRANWLTSLLFAAAHVWQHPLLLLPGYLVVSLVLGYFRERYNGILVPVALHAWYNLALLFLSGLLS